MTVTIPIPHTQDVGNGVYAQSPSLKRSCFLFSSLALLVPTPTVAALPSLGLTEAYESSDMPSYSGIWLFCVSPLFPSAGFMELAPVAGALLKGLLFL